MTKKPLRFFNGRICSPPLERSHGFIAAYSKAEAVRLGKEAFGFFSISELNEYWSEAWGNTMEGIHPEGPGVWITLNRDKTVWNFVLKHQDK